MSESRPAGQDLGKGWLRAQNRRLTYPASMEDNRDGTRTTPAAGRGGGPELQRKKVSPTRPNLQPTKGRMESVKSQGGSMIAKRSQEDHPAIQDEGTEKGKQLGKTHREQSNNGKTQAHRRVASTGDGKKPLQPHNRIPTVLEKPATLEELPWQRIRGRWRSRHMEQHQKRRPSTSRGKRDSPVLQGDGSHNQKGGQGKNKAHKPKS